MHNSLSWIKKNAVKSCIPGWMYVSSPNLGSLHWVNFKKCLKLFCSKSYSFCRRAAHGYDSEAEFTAFLWKAVGGKATECLLPSFLLPFFPVGNNQWLRTLSDLTLLPWYFPPARARESFYELAVVLLKEMLILCLASFAAFSRLDYIQTELSAQNMGC